MDDSLSIKSSDSTTTSDEYEFISVSNNVSKVPSNNTNEQPLLKIAGNGDINQLQKCLGEILNEENTSNGKKNMMSQQSSCESGEAPSSETASREEDESNEFLADVYQDCTLFGCISYLGSAAINAPKSKAEIIRNIAILNEQSSDQAIIKVSLSVPNTSDGIVILYDANNDSVMARYEIQRIMYYDNGPPKSNENSCFAFTYWHGDSQETALFQCHVFRCDIPEAVIQVSLCFGKAFQKPSLNTMTNSSSEFESIRSKSVHKYTLEVGLEIKEDDGKGNFHTVPRDKTSFKLRSNIRKQILVSIQQIPSKDQAELEIKRCFGFLMSPGWNVTDCDMQLLIPEKNEDEENHKNFTVACKWNPKSAFKNLSNETSKLRMTLAVDLAIRQIKESVRLPVRSQCKIYSQNERFWSFNKGQIFSHFNLYLQEVPYCNGNFEPIFKLINIEPVELDKSILNINYTWHSLTSLIRTTSTTSLEGMSLGEDYSDSDEPMMSGSGDVSKECADRVLLSWTEILSKWTDASVRPNKLTSLVQQGIPEALRGEVWQRLTISDKDEELLNTYRLLIMKECRSEATIKKDIYRTFPAHDYFKEVGGVGQDTLFNISKAYAVYDSEVGYYQGLTFIAASLLLHMPEEQAFCVLVKLMFHYGLRDLYKDDFEMLKLKQYQLSRLLEEKDRQLWQHFLEMGVETHMYAHLWFLTLYTARFPLYLVFFILDVVLVQGLDTILQIAVSLLIKFREDLLTLDFENIIKYIQVTLPKKCRKHAVAREVVKQACSIKLKKLKKYEEDYQNMKIARGHVERYNNEMARLQKMLANMEEEKRLLLAELTESREAILAKSEKTLAENQRNARIIADYKQICQRLDEEQTETRSVLLALKNKVAHCERCGSFVNDSSYVNGTMAANSVNSTKGDVDVGTKVKELELELARTKLALVEAECRNQDLTHQMGTITAELQTVRNQYPPWLHKTLSSIKDVTVNRKSTSGANVTNKLFDVTKTETILNQ